MSDANACGPAVGHRLTNGVEARAARQRPPRRRALWLAFAVVLVPLALLVAMQYWWLLDLERTSSLAERAMQQKILEGIAKEVVSGIAKHAEKILDIPSPWLCKCEEEKLAHLFAKKSLPVVRRYFVVDYRQAEGPRVLDPKVGRFEHSATPDEAVAIMTACAPFGVMFKKGVAVDRPHLHVDERSPAHRMVLFPITDDASHLLGVTGMILDNDVFEKEVLPKAIEVAMSSDRRLRVVVWVLNNTGRPVLPRGVDKVVKLTTVRTFPFVFTDWKIALQDLRTTTPEVWAKRNFAMNLTLSLVLAAVLLTGVVISLRTAARELRLCAMKSDFVSNVSHELRTPISSIRVFGELMRLGRVTDPGKIREYGGHIETESRRLTQLINNILDFSRIESGRKVYSFEAADLVQVVRDAVSTFDVRIRNTGFVVDVQTPAEPLPLTAVDAGALDQAICNLLDNAVKYSGDSREISVHVAREADGAVIAVTDRGIGIPHDEQKRIFDRFHRVSTGLVHEVRGVGLGLSIVQHIVSAHGGRIEVESEPGHGSTFAIHLPGALAPQAPASTS